MNGNEKTINEGAFDIIGEYPDNHVIDKKDNIIIYVDNGKTISANDVMTVDEDEDFLNITYIEQYIEQRGAGGVVLKYKSIEKHIRINLKHIISYEMISEVILKGEAYEEDSN